jgi:hypothetical protein
MTTLTIRNVGAAIKDRPRVCTAHNGRSMLRLAKKHRNSEALDTRDREDLQRFVTGLESQVPNDK